ncbi:Major Facilitator Superfamily (MFS) [Thraustotheca clavata]|uniref:Major Facilitator Superfamily (MFS) n=1 Tax=Thraustotheca clavata TaxID=74557 RepID=A0A1V9ZYN7_9STRA|nr:Major Facilitator Superfamily (MFS) [Thraustotheca clavata]
MLLNKPVHVFALLCVLNLFNFIDRGIIPGAPIQFQAFIQTTYGVPPQHVSVYMGILVSAFIASFSIAICIFGYLSMSRRPFFLAAIGLSFWLLSLVICGLAKSFDSFYMLLFGRILSGVGESSFHATTPSFIDDFAPPGKKSLWLGIFYSGMAAGTAIGYSYGSLMALTIGWDFAYYIIALLMAPLVYACFYWIPDTLNQPFGKDNHQRNDTHVLVVDHNAPHDVALLCEAQVSAGIECLAILKDPIFITSSIGLASYSFSIAGMSAFMPSILIGYGFLGEKYAATIFGLIAIVGGLVGAPLGGLLLDWSCREHKEHIAFRVFTSAKQMLIFMSLGVLCLFLSVYFVDTHLLYYIFLCIGILCLLSTPASTTVVVLLSFPKARRGFAVGLCTFFLHLFGDVPSPMILGALKDIWAPNCGSIVQEDGTLALDPLCYLDQSGLTLTLIFAYGWLMIGITMWIVTFFIARSRLLKDQPSAHRDTDTISSP